MTQPTFIEPTGAEPDDTDPADDDTAEVEEHESTAPTDAKPKPTAPKPPQQGREPKIEGDFDKDRYERTMARIRQEAVDAKEARRKAEQERNDTIRAIAKAAGIVTDDEQSPEVLGRKLAEAEAKIEAANAAERQRRTENMVLRKAPGLGADPDVLLDSTQFLKAISDISPDDGDGVEDTIRDFLAKSARYRLPSTPKTDTGDEAKKAPNTESKPAAGRSGADLNGQGTKPRQITPAELAKMSPKEIVEARGKGLLDSILNG